MTGDWTGQSICQVKSSPCQDEIAVYHISKGEQPGIYHFIMNKIVNGKEEDMGVLDYTFDTATGTLSSVDNKRKITWTFKVKNKAMNGTLVYNNVLYRIIKLSRTNKQ